MSPKTVGSQTQGRVEQHEEGQQKQARILQATLHATTDMTSKPIAVNALSSCTKGSKQKQACVSALAVPFLLSQTIRPKPPLRALALSVPWQLWRSSKELDREPRSPTWNRKMGCPAEKRKMKAARLRGSYNDLRSSQRAPWKGIFVLFRFPNEMRESPPCNALATCQALIRKPEQAPINEGRLTYLNT